MKKVYLDPGHGGTDSGAIGNGIQEKDIVLSVAKKVEAKLKKCNLDVRMSRTTDVYKTLEYRSSDANSWGADCFVSIHANSAEVSSAQGVETFCYKFAYRPLADKVHAEIINSKNYTKNRGVKEGDFHVVRETNMDACLVELSFISNTEDANLLKNKQEEFATAIAKGICNYLGVKFNSNPPIQDSTVYNILTGGFGAKEYAQQKLEHLHGLTGWYLTLEEFYPGDWSIRTGGFTGEERVKRKMDALVELTEWWCTYEKQ
ncbi:N-acetylmuramoyl-L-alanine amidase [Paraclostridium ghonii]|uniref:N-acetylmuramoyl-L-alanine amidase family protein n=1 Tax=Paraclostridium ghonii TaxID=29358 RepID=UPI00202CA9A2|nr:N-acetylmuramoyl-L-alanine amidase [Paeniclostridium ghonii]MCM0168115.1 N-acetylmuramoyl-L-alanine amidase [Paeniclostridium ghonii]